MGLFSKKESAPVRKPRPSVSSEAQASDLRSRARRRLAGAIVLILSAVIILPMLLDSEPAPIVGNIPIIIPDRQAPFQPNLSGPDTALAPLSPNAQGQTATPALQPGQTGASGGSSGAPNQGTTNSTASAAASAAAANSSPSTVTATPAKPETPPKPSAANTNTQKPPATPPRRDESARAQALLEGRAPVASAPSPAAPSRGNFVVQAMSLDSADDAQKQRSVLVAAGLNNAFVDGPVTVNGRPKYRVRVGPFQSREAAQAAQTRLRTQGYGGAFITSQ